MTISKRQSAVLDIEATDAFAHLFQAMADRSRLSLLQHLSLGEHRVRDLVDHLDLAQSTVSKHIAFLVECGLVDARLDGRSTWYALTEPVALGALIVAAERLLEATGSRYALCAHLTDAARSVERTSREEHVHGNDA
ncbi:metalloregulator ArsR/SmtB family transcription factor [Agrococcus sp. ProA11]|uniref:ArsR/SmtB family transcription factor n=1 Tax=Agrococcus chionoecetis TaxID=3153752 RepID=UPI00326069FB